jgi:hypothetical protein
VRYDRGIDFCAQGLQEVFRTGEIKPLRVTLFYELERWIRAIERRTGLALGRWEGEFSPMPGPGNVTANYPTQTPGRAHPPCGVSCVLHMEYLYINF